jgi:fucose 4-O-acetylase-like acetyltransferase
MNTQPVKALATVDKRKITWNDIKMQMSEDQRLGLLVVSSFFGSAVFVGILTAGLYLSPVITVGTLLATPMLYAGHTLRQAYQKASRER